MEDEKVRSRLHLYDASETDGGDSLSPPSYLLPQGSLHIFKGKTWPSSLTISTSTTPGNPSTFRSTPAFWHHRPSLSRRIHLTSARTRVMSTWRAVRETAKQPQSPTPRKSSERRQHDKDVDVAAIGEASPLRAVKTLPTNPSVPISQIQCSSRSSKFAKIRMTDPSPSIRRIRPFKRSRFATIQPIDPSLSISRI